MGKFALVLQAAGAADVVDRELVFAVNGGEPITQNLPGTAVESDLFEGEEGQIAAGQLVDIDDAGNRSEPRTFEVELVDTIAPPMPGEIGIRMVEE